MLSNNELKKISGGFNFGIGFLIASGITFVVGLFDGYVRPLACRR